MTHSDTENRIMEEDRLTAATRETGVRIREMIKVFETAFLPIRDAISAWRNSLPPWVWAIYEEPPAPKTQRRQWRNHPQRRKHRH